MTVAATCSLRACGGWPSEVCYRTAIGARPKGTPRVQPCTPVELQLLLVARLLLEVVLWEERTAKIGVRDVPTAVEIELLEEHAHPDDRQRQAELVHCRLEADPTASAAARRLVVEPRASNDQGARPREIGVRAPVPT